MRPAVTRGRGSGASAALPRLVLLYATCTLNRDFLGPYNADVEFTPYLKRFAEQAVVFRRHVSEAGQSGIAFASIFSGMQAPGHGVFSQPTPLPESVHTITEAFAASGFETFFWGGHPVAGGTQDYGQGATVFRRGLKAQDQAFQALLTKLRDDPDARAFVSTNFTITHTPYRSDNLVDFLDTHPRHADAILTTHRPFAEYLRIHEEEFRQFSGNFAETVERLKLSPEEVEEYSGVMEVLYRSNVHALDQRFGAVLDALEQYGLDDESLITFTADHGERMYRPGVLFPWTHGWELAPEVLTVPWIVRGPRGADGTRRPRPGDYEPVTRSMDVFPTLSGWMGLRPHESRDPWVGRDLSPVLRGEQQPPTLEAWSHTTVLRDTFLDNLKRAAVLMTYHRGAFLGEMWVSMRTGDRLFKYRNLDGTTWGYELFDLAEDPLETHNLFDEADPDHARMADRLLGYHDQLMEGWRQSDEPAIDPEAEQAMREMGYIR